MPAQRTDTDRLDWLESFPADVNEIQGGGWQVWSATNSDRHGDSYPECSTPRDAIDAAIDAEGAG